VLCLAIPAIGSAEDQDSVKAITAITLPLDSVTIYPDGLTYVRRMGSIDVNEGLHEFVMDVPEAADDKSVRLWVSNATTEKVIYGANPTYTLDFSSSGEETFLLTYLMYSAASWVPRYTLNLLDGSVDMSADAVIVNKVGEDLKGVRIRLVAGLPSQIYDYAAAAPAAEESYDKAASRESSNYFPAEPSSTGELESLFVFDLGDRKDLEADKEVGFPLLGSVVPVERIYTWDAEYKNEGPVTEEVRANNTMQVPWPSGTAQVYSDGEYVSTIQIPYTPNGTNASLNVGSSADLKVEKKLLDYNVTETIREVKAEHNSTSTVKETNTTSVYSLEVESNLDRPALLEITDSYPMASKMLYIAPEPSELTATGLKWRIALDPREKTTIEYAYSEIDVETVSGSR